MNNEKKPLTFHIEPASWMNIPVMDTLSNILGTEPGTKAKTYNSTTEIWTIVEQHKNNRGELYWVHYEEGKGCDPTRLEDFDFKNIAFFYDVNEPIWITA